MPQLPHILDNLRPETEHAAGLAALLANFGPEHELAVATGYVNLGGLHELARVAADRRTRLLIGAAPDPGLGAPPILDRFTLQLENLRSERDFSRFPPSRWAERMQEVCEWLAREEVEVRRYSHRFLHGKAYLLGSEELAHAALVTSANLTSAGMHGNLELGLTSYGPPAAVDAFTWFDALWADGQPFEDDLVALLFPQAELVDPLDVYLRALLELHDPVDPDPGRATRPTGLELAPFQRDGYERARAIAREHGGVIYADGVGTGKTEIGLAFIEERIKEAGLYALVVTPAQLQPRWEERIRMAKLSAQVISFNELASDEQLNPGSPSARRRLDSDKDAYRLVIVDEAHALRNEDTSWHRAMERLLGGSRKQVIMLTATPINNGLWDLYNLVMLFARHDRGMAGAGIDSIRDLFLRAGASSRDSEDLDPDQLFPLADAVSVRRDRRFIERNYEDATFPDGTPVRFPTPRLTTERYDLDGSHPGLFERIATEIEELTMARYRPGAYALGDDESQAEAQLGGLLRSGLLKRFESCWRACLETTERMIAAHDAFLAAWSEGRVLSRDQLKAAARALEDEAGMAGWVEQALEEEGGGSTEATAFDPGYGDAVAADRERLGRIRDELDGLDPGSDPKLAVLRELLDRSPAEKVAVFATFGATVRYLDENLPELVGGRERIVVVGGETTPDERIGLLRRFAPATIVRPGYEPPEGERDLLISTDVLSEGQNLQQAQAVISYDMPWNPQRVVQRNGRVVRLLSPHEEVLLTTMLPEPGELDRLLGLEATIQGKVKAAGGVYGMEIEVIEGLAGELRSFAARLESDDASLLDEAEESSGAFAGEELRRMLDRALEEGEIDRIRALPWGIGACFRQTEGGRSQGAPGVFFATRTRPAEPGGESYAYWRFVEIEGGEPVAGTEPIRTELEILRRIDPSGGQAADLGEVDLEAAWELASASIVGEHNARSDLRAGQESIGAKQRWALDVLRDPAVVLPGVERAEAAAGALEAARSSAVRRRLGDAQERLLDAAISRDEAAAEIVAIVEEYGLRPVEPLPVVPPIEVEDLGVVCWMAVLSGAAGGS